MYVISVTRGVARMTPRLIFSKNATAAGSIDIGT